MGKHIKLKMNQITPITYSKNQQRTLGGQLKQYMINKEAMKLEMHNKEVLKTPQTHNKVAPKINLTNTTQGKAKDC